MRAARPAALAIVLAAISTELPAQQGALEEVIVTATKRAQSLQDIPVTVNAISEMTIQDAGINDVGDVAALVPSLTVATNINPFAAGIRIRGFGTNQNDPSLEASVAFILDGIYMGRSGLGMSDLTDIERVEVLQGPQGTLYGKNSNAGVVSVITKNPSTEETEGYIEGTLGNYDLQKYVGVISGPISESVAYRLSGSWHEHDGWLESNTGADLNAVEDWNIRGKLQWLPSEALSILMTASHVERDTSCCGADARQTAAVTDELVKQGLPVPKNDAFDYKNNVDVDSKFDLSADAVNIKLDYEFQSATLTSLTAWNDYDYTTAYDAERSDLAVLDVEKESFTGELWSQELRLTSDFDGPLQYILGMYYANDELTRRGPSSGLAKVGDDAPAVGGAQTGLGPLFAVAAQPGDTVLLDNRWKTEAFALFGQSTYSFSERWEMTLGLRYTDESKDADLYTLPISSSPLYGTGRTLVEQAFAAIDDSFKKGKDGVTGLASLTYFMREDIMLFASVATGSKSGGFNGVAGEGAPREFDDEESTNYELGLKSELLDNRLQLNLTAFYTQFDDLQFLTQQQSGVGTFVSNAAEGTSKGVDLSFTAAPFQFLNLSGGLQYLDAKYTEGLLHDAGLDVSFAPDWSGFLAATVFMPLADGVTYLRGDYSFMGDHFTNAGYQPDSTEQDKELLNLRLGWRNDNWDAALWVKNATDEAYSSLSGAPIAFTGTEAEWLEAPRTYGATLRYSF